MSDIITVEALLDSMALERLETNIYRGLSHDIGTNHVFGGQVLSQAIDAAISTVPEGRHIHSIHAYFILPGDLNHPIIYMVDPIRDGGSFTTRRVKAVQHGKDIFILAASFQLIQKGQTHQIAMPPHIGPDDLISDHELLDKFGDQLPKGIRRFLKPRPIEFRPVNPLQFIATKEQDPHRQVWFRAKGDVPDNPNIQQRLLAYASDYNLLTTAIQPHQHQVQIHDLQLASLDHAMWFHRDFDITEWLLYDIDSPSASNARGFTRGNIFDRTGRLIASVVQEGLIRPKHRNSSTKK